MNEKKRLNKNVEWLNNLKLIISYLIYVIWYPLRQRWSTSVSLKNCINPMNRVLYKENGTGLAIH